ncbi:MAG TPA: GntR family transcriptional regulator [Longimicrobiales bacterium]|nr:GntR family transcriptional regulator [Longimicrobiales bacterium]
MSRAQPGAVILDQLRDRIVTGLYFGNWQPGERLPSIRDIADAESVDRKTAAAAYHRLEEEGLVEVKARSGVFLRDERENGTRNGNGGPLEKLQRRWLKNTYDGARALGLDTRTVLRVFGAVAEVEANPVPVVEEDEATARTVAEELRDCVGIDARPVSLADVTARGSVFASAAFAVTTPYYAARVSRALPGTPLIIATLSLDLLYSLMERAAVGMILVVVPSQWIASRVEAALRQRAPNMDRTRVVAADGRTDLQQLRREAACIFVWPGCDDVLSAFEGDECVKPVRLLSETTTDRVRTAVLDAALRTMGAPVSTSTVVAAL